MENRHVFSPLSILRRQETPAYRTGSLRYMRLIFNARYLGHFWHWHRWSGTDQGVVVHFSIPSWVSWLRCTFAFACGANGTSEIFYEGKHEFRTDRLCCSVRVSPLITLSKRLVINGGMVYFLLEYYTLLVPRLLHLGAAQVHSVLGSLSERLHCMTAVVWFVRANEISQPVLSNATIWLVTMWLNIKG